MGMCVPHGTFAAKTPLVSAGDSQEKLRCPKAATSLPYSWLSLDLRRGQWGRGTMSQALAGNQPQVRVEEGGQTAKAHKARARARLSVGGVG